MDPNNNDTEVPEDQPEEQALQLNVKDFCIPIKGKSQTTKKGTCQLSIEHHSDKRKELD